MEVRKAFPKWDGSTWTARRRAWRKGFATDRTDGADSDGSFAEGKSSDSAVLEVGHHERLDEATALNAPVAHPSSSRMYPPTYLIVKVIVELSNPLPFHETV